jgi:flagellar hook-length control protein FliK
LTPVSEHMTDAGASADTGAGTDTANGQVVGEGGNALPGEQELPVNLPAMTVTGEATRALQLPTLPGSTENVEPGLLPAPDSPGPAITQPAAVPTDAAAVLVTAGGNPVSNGQTTRPGGEADVQQAQPAHSRLQPALAAPAELTTAVRDSAVSGNRVDPGLATPVPPPGSTAPGANGTAGDATLAAVRASVQQALAAQVAQDGLRQSLAGGERNSKPLPSMVTANTLVDVSAASFTTMLAGAAGISSSARVAVPVGEAGWARAVGEQVVWHVSQNIQSANLRLNPQHLGPLEMQVQMDGDRATVVFASQHAAVRDALESALPRLREMFSQNGMDIVDVNVSQQDSPGREQQQAAAGGSQAVNDDENMMSGERSSGLVPGVTESLGLVDYYI